MKNFLAFAIVVVVTLTATTPVLAQVENQPSGEGWECFEFAPVPVGTVVILKGDSPIDQIWIDGEFFYESISEEESNLYMILDLGTTEVRVKKEQSPQIAVLCYHMFVPATPTSVATSTPVVTATPRVTVTPTSTTVITEIPVSEQSSTPTLSSTVKVPAEKKDKTLPVIAIIAVVLFFLILGYIKLHRHH